MVNGSQIDVGRHRLTLTHRKAETVTTNIFAWYGGCDLGDVVLKRSRATLALTVNPPAQSLLISGPEFRIELTNSAGLTSSIPTDAYLVTAKWLNHSETNRITIMGGHDTAFQYSPSLGTASITSEPLGARVIQRNGREMGITPLTLREVKAGTWK